MVQVIDFMSVGNMHILFNASILKILLNISHYNDVVFYGEKSHLSILKQYFNLESSSDIKFKELELNISNKKGISKIFKIVKKTLSDIKTFFIVSKKVKSFGSGYIYICNASVVVMICTKIINRIFFNRIKIIYTLHGEIEYIYSSVNVRERIIGYLYQLFLSYYSSSCYYLLLNKISKTILVNDGYLTEHNTFDINHPYIFDNNINLSNSSKLVVGHVGSMGVRKNSQCLYQLASKFRDEILDNKIQFWSIGAIESNMYSFMNEYVFSISDKNKENYLSRDIFEQKLSQITYAIFFYSTQQFIFRASGAVLDALKFNKPIIALNHPYFNYLFEQAGDIGFLCNSQEEISELIKKLIAGDETLVSRYSTQIDNICNYKNNILNIDNIANDLKNKLEHILT